MPFLPLNSFTSLESFIRATGHFDHAQIGEPQSPAESGLSAYIIADSVTTPELVLDAPVRVFNIVIRCLTRALEDGRQTELDMLTAVAQLLADIEGDFDLGGELRAIDVGGTYTQSTSVDFDWIDEKGTMYRRCDIALGLIFDTTDTFG
jgi:hypothetical protein